MFTTQNSEAGDLEAIVAEAVDKMKRNLSDSIALCSRRHRKTGYSLNVLETMMNTKYFELHNQLQEFIKHSTQSSEAMQFFEAECGKVRNEMVTQYLQCKSAALTAALNSASFNLDYCIKNNVTYLPSQLNNHATSVQRHLLSTVSGWLEDTSSDNTSTSSRNSVKDDFIVELQTVLNNDIDQYKRHLLSSSGKKHNKINTPTAPVPVVPKPTEPTQDEQMMSFIANLRNTVVTSLQQSHHANAPLVLEQVNSIFNAKFNELEACLPSADSKSVFRKHCDALYSELSSELTGRPRSNSTATTVSDVGSTSSLSSLAATLNHKAQLANRSTSLPMSRPVSVFNDNNNSQFLGGSFSNSMQLAARNKRKSHIITADLAASSSTVDMSTLGGGMEEESPFVSSTFGTTLSADGDGDSNHVREESTPSNLASVRRKPTTTSLFTGSVGAVESRKHLIGGSTQMVLTPNKGASVSSSGGGNTPGGGSFSHISSMQNNSAAVLHHSSLHGNLSRDNLIAAKRRKNEAVYNSTGNASHPLVINSTFPVVASARTDAKRAEEERISAMVNNCANRVNKKIIKGSGKYAL